MGVVAKCLALLALVSSTTACTDGACFCPAGSSIQSSSLCSASISSLKTAVVTHFNTSSNITLAQAQALLASTPSGVCVNINPSLRLANDTCAAFSGYLACRAASSCTYKALSSFNTNRPLNMMKMLSENFVRQCCTGVSYSNFCSANGALEGDTFSGSQSCKSGLSMLSGNFSEQLAVRFSPSPGYAQGLFAQCCSGGQRQLDCLCRAPGARFVGSRSASPGFPMTCAAMMGASLMSSMSSMAPFPGRGASCATIRSLTERVANPFQIARCCDPPATPPSTPPAAACLCSKFDAAGTYRGGTADMAGTPVPCSVALGAALSEFGPLLPPNGTCAAQRAAIPPPMCTEQGQGAMYRRARGLPNACSGSSMESACRQATYQKPATCFWMGGGMCYWDQSLQTCNGPTNSAYSNVPGWLGGTFCATKTDMQSCNSAWYVNRSATAEGTGLCYHQNDMAGMCAGISSSACATTTFQETKSCVWNDLYPLKAAVLGCCNVPSKGPQFCTDAGRTGYISAGERAPIMVSGDSLGFSCQMATNMGSRAQLLASPSSAPMVAVVDRFCCTGPSMGPFLNPQQFCTAAGFLRYDGAGKNVTGMRPPMSCLAVAIRPYAPFYAAAAAECCTNTSAPAQAPAPAPMVPLPSEYISTSVTIETASGLTKATVTAAHRSAVQAALAAATGVPLDYVVVYGVRNVGDPATPLPFSRRRRLRLEQQGSGGAIRAGASNLLARAEGLLRRQLMNGGVIFDVYILPTGSIGAKAISSAVTAATTAAATDASSLTALLSAEPGFASETITSASASPPQKGGTVVNAEVIGQLVGLFAMFAGTMLFVAIGILVVVLLLLILCCYCCCCRKRNSKVVGAN